MARGWNKKNSSPSFPVNKNMNFSVANGDNREAN